MKADKKNRIHVVYSTDPNYNYEYNNETEDETLPPEKQNLRVILDSKQRKGKTVTLVQGFVGREDDLKELAKLLKNKCGVGGSVKDGEIIIQGEVKEKVLNILRENKYRAKGCSVTFQRFYQFNFPLKDDIIFFQRSLSSHFSLLLSVSALSL